jgi:hypothetical protein
VVSGFPATELDKVRAARGDDDRRVGCLHCIDMARRFQPAMSGRRTTQWCQVKNRTSRVDSHR